LNIAAIDDLGAVNDADHATREVVFAFAIHPGHLRCLASNQGTTGGSACARKTAQQLMKNARLKFFATDVIQKEKRSRAQDCDVIYTVVNQIGADGVVLVHCERDFQFRPNTIDARDEYRFVHSVKVRRKQTAKAAEFSKHLHAVRSLDE